jgi:hypothetical protein
MFFFCLNLTCGRRKGKGKGKGKGFFFFFLFFHCGVARERGSNFGIWCS